MDTHELGSLPELWHLWTEVVAMFASRRSGARRVNPAEYQVLHRALLKACQAQTDGANEERRACLKTLEQLIGPWLNSGSLEHADLELLADVRARCRNVENTPAGRALLGPARRGHRLAFLVLGSIVIGGFFLAVGIWVWPALGELLQSVWIAARFRVRELPEIGRWVGVGGLLVLVYLLIALAGTARR